MTPASRSTPPAASNQTLTPPQNPLTGKDSSLNSLEGVFIGSPLKKQRASISGSEDLRQRLGTNISTGIHEAMGLESVPQNANHGATISTEISMDGGQKASAPQEEEL